jgi:glycosyltransferase involved in cell wall biosynthesis
MVQVESMLCGTPVVASDLPGVRQPVMISGMGRVVPAADVQALAQAIISILDHPEKFRGDPASIAERFSPETVAVAYEEIFNRLLNREQAKVDKPRYSTKNQP